MLKHICKKALSILLAVTMLLSLIPMASAEDILSVKGGDTINQDGVYEIEPNATGTITIDEGVSKVTLVGGGAAWNENYAYTSTPFSNLYINCTRAPGIALTLQDVHINNTQSQSTIDFSDTGNTLIISGTNVLDYVVGGGSNPAAIHVASGTELTVTGTGTLYFYKSAQGSGFGGSSVQLNGTINFGEEGKVGPTVFAKGTKQGALIGAGSSAPSTGTPGPINFFSGTYNLISNSRGSVIGGSAGSTGASAGTIVTFGKNASVNINVDYSGSAVGGGGYSGGNDAKGGKAYFAGGSVRVYIDKNAAENTGWGGWAQGVNDSAITALRLNNRKDETPVYKLAFNTKELSVKAEEFTVLVDGKPYYTGGLHGYSFIQENLDKQTGEQLPISSTPSNWRQNDDSCLYLYLTAEKHELTVNGEKFNVTCDQGVIGTSQEYTSGPFTVSMPGDPDALVWDGTLDFRWYDPTNVKTEYHITTPAQWAALAWICSEHLEDLQSFETNTVGNVKDIYGTIPTEKNTFTGVKFYLDNDIDMGGVYDANGKTWSGPNYYPVGSQAQNDRKDGNFYGLFFGSFDGQGHIVSNIYCDRGTGQTYESVGLFGRVGAADGKTEAEKALYPDCNIVIENVAVTGYIKAGRSVGGIVGKTLHVAPGRSVTVRNCLNFADITSSDAKGTAGIVGAGWNKPVSIDNCANFGTVVANYKNGGGISGSFEGNSYNCYNVGDISKSAANNGQAFGSNNGVAVVKNFYWLTGTSNTTGDNAAIFKPGLDSTTYEVTDNYQNSDLSAQDYMKNPAFLTALNNGGSTWAFALASDPIYRKMDSMGLAGYPVPAAFATALATVRFSVTPAGAAVAVTHGGDTVTPQGDGSYLLVKGLTYGYNVSASGYVTQSGTILAGDNRNISLTLAAEEKPDPGNTGTGNVNATVWDGKSIDVSWFNKNSYDNTDSYYIGTPAQLAGLAALVNGIYNAGIDTFAGDRSAIKAHKSTAASSGTGGNNMSTATYHYGEYDFSGKTVYLTADIDMGKANYMPIGGQYLMTDEDTTTKLGSSFCGMLDGQGHSVTLQADRHCSGNYGDGQSVGLIGRLGVHDDDPESLRPSGAGVRNLAVYGSVYANRSVGGVVGKIGKTNGGAFIENCANFAFVKGTDAKGTGGIVGAAWNGGEIRNCYNAGAINNTHNAYGGIAGSNEISLVNCYNVGKVTGAGTSAAIASENGGGSYANCYWLEGTADMGVYNKALDGVVMKTAAEMKGTAFLNVLGKGFAQDTKNQNNGYPVLSWQNTSAPTGNGGGTAAGGTQSVVTIDSTTTVTGGKASTAVTEAAAAAGIKAAAKTGEKGLVVQTDTKGTAAASTTVSVPKTSAKEIAKAGLELTLQSADNSRVTLSPASLVSVAEQAGGSTLEIAVRAETRQAASDILSTAKNLDSKSVDLDSNLVVSVTVRSGGKEISSFAGSMTIDLPVDGARYTQGQSYRVIQISADGSVETLPGICAKVNGVLCVRMSVNHLSTFVVTSARAFAGYDDVKPGNWYYDAVGHVTGKGLMGGTGGGKFSPEGGMTRAMLATVLYRLEGSPAVSTGSGFTDVASGQWYADAVKWAASKKLMDGYGNSQFGTNDSVTRQQIAAILYRYAALKGHDTAKTADLKAYSDAAEVASWAQGGMAWANASGLINGRTAEILAPGGTATRAEVAIMLMRLSSLMVK